MTDAQDKLAGAMRERLTAEVVAGLDHAKVYQEARRRMMRDATMQGYDHHAARVVAEMVADKLISRLLAEAAGMVRNYYDDEVPALAHHVCEDIATAIERLEERR